MIQQKDLIGAWSLRDFRVRFSDGRDDHFPFGEDAQGKIIYSAEGQMSAVLSHKKRGTMDSLTLETSAKASDADKAAAFDSYLSYAGRYTFNGSHITHHVELALFPNATKGDQVRKVAMRDGILTLSYERTPKSGVTRHYQLTWERC